MRKYWIRPANIKYYDVVSAYTKHAVLDWTSSNNYSIGDIVYIYLSKPYKYVLYKCEVVSVNIKREDRIDDSEFWINEDMSGFNFVRLKLISTLYDKHITLDKLSILNLQGPRTLNSLQVYMLEDSDGEDLTEYDDIYEGHKLTIKVNKYERSLVAREACIKHFGCKCLIFGFDFEKRYGKLGENFIHVHHVVPLSKMNKEYKVNYEMDLIPVCPNCHAMIHRLDCSENLTIGEIIEKLSFNKDNKQ